MNWLVKKNATKILSNSQAALDFFFPKMDKDSGKFKVIYNGIDASKFCFTGDNLKIRDELGIPRDAFVVGHIGRFNEAKNHKTIFEVAEKVCKSNNNIFFVWCGKDIEAAFFDKLEKNLLLSKRIIILGYRSDVNRVLKCFDIFFFPSVTEGQPNALIEALIYGLPILASNINPIRETVPKELYDFLLEPYDVKGFSEKIEKIYGKEIELKNFSKWAKKKYDHNKLFNQFMNELHL